MRTIGGILALTLLLAAPIGAQDRPVEIGLDGGLQIILPEEGDSFKQLSFPTGTMRLGFYLSSRMAFEPSVSLGRSWDNDDSVTSIFFQPNFVLYFRDFDRIPQPYIRAGAGVDYRKWDGDWGNGSDHQFNAVAGAGVKVPVLERAFFRFEANFRHVFEGDDAPSHNALGITVGISVVAN